MQMSCKNVSKSIWSNMENLKEGGLISGRAYHRHNFFWPQTDEPITGGAFNWRCLLKAVYSVLVRK